MATIPAKFRGRARRDAAAFYLSQLAKGILSGELAVLSGQQEPTLATAEFVILDIVVTQRTRANRVEIELRWPARPLIRVAATEGSAMGDGNTFEFEGAASPAEAADTLTRIAEGIRARALSPSMARTPSSSPSSPRPRRSPTT